MSRSLAKHGLAWRGGAWLGMAGRGEARQGFFPMREMELGSLKLDLGLFPRKEVNEDHVAALMESLRANVVLPEIVVCSKTRKIVDGFHRYTAYERVYGLSHVVWIIERQYRDERALFLDAIRLNASHGLPLTAGDHRACALTASKLGVSADDLSLSLNVRLDKAEQLLRVATPQAVTLAPRHKTTNGHAKNGRHRTNAERIEIPQEGIRCPACGVKLLPGASCLDCKLKQASEVSRDLAFHVNWIISFCSRSLNSDEDKQLRELLGVLKERLPERLLERSVCEK